MKEKQIKVLLVEDELGDICLLEEALAEIAETQYRRGWVLPCDVVQVSDLAEALEVLREIDFDVIVLDPTLPDSDPPTAFSQIRAQAPGVPIIVLATNDDEALAISLVRQGAQDYLIKSELDCVPLARALRCAIERQRFLMSMIRLCFLDDLTGLYTWGGFLNLADRQWRLAQRTNQGLLLYLVEVDDPPDHAASSGIQEADMALILTAEALRDTFDEADLIARHSANRFCVLSLDGGGSVPGDVVRRVLKDIVASTAKRRGHCGVSISVGVADLRPGPTTSIEHLLQAAERALCENKQNKSKAEIREFLLTD